MTPDKDGNLPPSALVPFCSYQGDSSLLGQKIRELDNITMCDRFKPTILEGQLCYSLEIAKLDRKPTKSGKANGLFLLLDPHPYQLSSSSNLDGNVQNQQSYKVYIHTLAPFTTKKAGSFAMNALKRMTGTENFHQLPDKQKKCQLHSREACQTKELLSRIKNNCSCVPWPLMTASHSEKVILLDFFSHPTSF